MIDFIFFGSNRGEYNHDLMRGFCVLPQHSSKQDIIETITHETIHAILSENFATTEKQDHFFLDKLGFIDDWIIE